MQVGEKALNHHKKGCTVENSSDFGVVRKLFFSWFQSGI
jgi:hypothetical protein